MFLIHALLAEGIEGLHWVCMLSGCVGDFFDVEVDKRDKFKEDFYILQCEKEVHYCDKAFVDPWG